MLEASVTDLHLHPCSIPKTPVLSLSSDKLLHSSYQVQLLLYSLLLHLESCDSQTDRHRKGFRILLSRIED
jgi:hypothetical protein